jgi:hypothetical protein
MACSFCSSFQRSDRPIGREFLVEMARARRYQFLGSERSLERRGGATCLTSSWLFDQ